MPDHALSRVSAYDWLVSTALRPLGLAAVGPVAVIVGVRTTLNGVAAVVVMSSLALLGLPGVRSLRRRGDIEPAGATASGTSTAAG